MKITTRQLVYYAIFAAITVVLAQLAIPLPGGVPLSLATFAVMLSGALLGRWGGFASQCVYILLGVVGIPVFAELQGGLGRIAGPTGGYIVGYALMALTIGLIVSKAGQKFWVFILSMIIGNMVLYVFGTVWFMLVTGSALLPALLLCVFPFLIGDALKIIFASLLATKLKKFICI